MKKNKKVISLKERKKPDKDTLKLKFFAEDLDSLIKKYLKNNQNGKMKILGVLASRVGNVLNSCENKHKLLNNIIKIIRQKSEL